MRILIVDDSRAMRMIVKRTLRQAGYGEHEFEEAANGLEAQKIINLDPPHLVLCDWNMPEMSGIELLTNVRNEGCEVPFGFVTSESTNERRKQARDAGALFLIAKPFTTATVRQVLDPILL